MIDYTKANYAAWKWNYKDIPKKGSIEEVILFFLRAGILAPSIHNTQPWKFSVKKNSLEIFPDWNYYLPQADPTKKNIFISLGCCITNIESAAAYHGYKTEVNVKGKTPENTFVQVSFKKTPLVNKELAKLCPYITKRYSNKLEYLKNPIKSQSLGVLNKKTLNSTITHLTSNKNSIQKIADLQETAVKSLGANKNFTKELSSWLRMNNSPSDDGMPAFVAGLKPIQAMIVKSILKKFPSSITILAKKDKKLLKDSPTIGLISTLKNDINSAISTGRLYEKVALTAASLVLNCTPMHSVIENQKTARKVKQLFEINTNIPAFLFRLGYSNNTPSYRTPRRRLEKFLLEMTTEKNLIKSIKASISTKSIKIDNFQINYVVAGKGHPLVLIHGGNIGWGQWYPNIPELAKHFKVYAIDLVGGGRSTKIDYANLNIDYHLLQITNRIVNSLKLQNPHIVGSSISGWIAMKLALNNKNIGKLVLIDAIGFSDFMRPQDKLIGLYPFAKFLTKTALNPKRSNKNIEMFIRSVFYNKNLPLSKEFIEYFYETMVTSHNLLFISKLTQNIKKTYLYKELPNIINKTLIIWGEKDQLMPIEKSEPNFYRIPYVKVIKIKNAGHFPSLENHREFNNEVVKFLKNK